MWNKRDRDRLSQSTEKDVGIDMMDQYKKETSQIHAPADLVQRTKLAMQQEEQRLRESASKADRQDNAVVMQRETVAGGAKRNFKSPHRIYKWTLPLSAAAAILILVSVSTVMRSSKADYSASDMAADSGYENEMDMQFSEAAIAEDAIEENEMLIDESPAKPDRKDAKEDYADYAMEESADTAAEDMEPTEAAESRADVESEASMKDMEESTSTNGIADRADTAEEEAKAKAEIEITKVDEEPAFYDDPDTESYLYENLLFWADQDENGEWFAYVGVRGDKYVIVSTIKDQEEFLEKAYELVSETRGSVK
ncbi:MAG: hypothetical protein J6K48_10980 [Lachnospiraceae bacterium]|nr:hypothetical protein [Lachnospiraceae bacterium]